MNVVVVVVRQTVVVVAVGVFKSCSFWLVSRCSANHQLSQRGIKTMILLGDREESVANIAKTVGINGEEVKSSLTPQQKSRVISSLEDVGYQVAMIGDGLNDASSLALAEVGIALQTAAQETAASDAASIILLGNKLSRVHTVS